MFSRNDCYRTEIRIGRLTGLVEVEASSLISFMEELVNLHLSVFEKLSHINWNIKYTIKLNF